MARKKRQNPDIPPGFTLRFTLKHTGVVRCVAWSPDGTLLASGTRDGTIHLWDGQNGQPLHTLTGHTSSIESIAWSPDENMLASGSEDGTIRLWNGHSEQPLRIIKSFNAMVRSVAWSPDSHRIASGLGDGIVRLWNGQRTGRALHTMKGHKDIVESIAWLPDSNQLASSARDGTIRLWDGRTGQCILNAATGIVESMIWLPGKSLLASGLDDGTVRLYDEQMNLLHILEGHTEAITCVSPSHDGAFLASKALDGTVRIWHTATWNCVAVLQEPTIEGYCPAVLAFHPAAPILVTHDQDYAVLRVWDLDVDTLLQAEPVESSVYYTTARIALVGDSSVGKSGLGYRIAEQRFQVTESTHGQQFWVVEPLGTRRADGVQCEAVLWDFAGQPNFRPIHALFLDDVDLALILFDPARPDTLTGVDYWLKQLAHKGHICHTILVSARSDVSTLTTPAAELEEFCRTRHISGSFIVTSAKSGEGIPELLERIRQQIDWQARPTTITTQTFKRIKDYVLALKAQAEHREVLVEPAALRAALEAQNPDWQVRDAEVLGATAHLQNHGYVTILRRSAEGKSILLAPDLLINLAASYLLKAQANEKGLGSIEEARALRNEYRFPEVEDLAQQERAILLNAVTELFLTRAVCFRESIDGQTFLIFPALILERPARMVEAREIVEDAAYIVTGLVENVYAALVVLLGYARTFQRVSQWRKQAQYETVRGDICGFRLANDDPAELEIVLYYGKDTPDYVRLRFQGLFEEILYARNVMVEKYLPVFCPKCHRQQERRTVIRRLQEGQKFLFCEQDGRKIALSPPTRRVLLSHDERADVERDQALSKLRTLYETALVSVKAVLRDRATSPAPLCFVSYAWGNPQHERWVLQLSDDLQNAGIDVVLDQLHNPAIGASVPRFISRIEQSDFILVVGTPSYRQKYENRLSQYGSVVAAEVDLINVRLTGTESQKTSVLPLLLAGEERQSLPPLLHRRVYADFTRPESYFVALFDVILTLHTIPFSDATVRDLREQLSKAIENIRKRGNAFYNTDTHKHETA